MSFKINKNEKFGCQNTVSRSSFTESMKIVFSYEVILHAIACNRQTFKHTHSYNLVKLFPYLFDTCAIYTINNI